MSFARGHRKLGGRRPGVPNRVTAEGRELARRLIEDPQYQRSLRRRLIRGEAGHIEAVLWQYVVGKPKDSEPPTHPPATLAAAIAQIPPRPGRDGGAI